MSNLKETISRGQGVDLEFKSSVDCSEEIAQTIVAFANTNGGRLLFGVKKNGKVIGSNPDEDLKNIKKLIKDFCFAPISFESKIHNNGRHLVLEFIIPKSEMKHKARNSKGELNFYHRIGDQTLLVNRVVIQLWKLQENEIPMPEKNNDKATVLIDLIKMNQPVTISKLFRLTSMNKNDVNKLLALLIYRNIVTCINLESGVGYIIHKKV